MPMCWLCCLSRRQTGSEFNKPFQYCRIQVLPSFWNPAGMFEVPCVQGWNSGIWLLSGWLQQTCRSQGSQGTTCQPAIGGYVSLEWGMSTGGWDSVLEGLCQHRDLYMKPACFTVFAGNLVKQEEVILDYNCKAGLGSCWNPSVCTREP